jgi:FG-GAP-like repeat
LNNGSGFFANSPASLPADIYNAQDVTLGDWDGDFDIDIIQTGKGTAAQRSALWLNNGNGTFAASALLNASGSGNTYEGDPADLDGDGDLDIAQQSITGFSEGWVRNNGASVTNITFSGTNSHDDNEMASLDYDNDGDLDVVVGSLSGPNEKAYQNVANVFTHQANIFPAGGDSTMDFAFADLNNDRRIDMVTGQGESGNFLDKVFVNNGPQDTRVPTVQATQNPGAIGATATVYKARVRDALIDDGHINATARLIFATPAASGLASAINQGCGTFRAAVGTAGASSVSACWVIQDQAGNTTQGTGTTTLGVANGWAVQAAGLAGVRGVPVLAGAGANQANTAGYLGLFGARSNAISALLIGTAAGNLPFFGGTLVPFPIIAQVNISTDAKGEVAFPYVMPATIPGGLDIYLQWAISDAAAVQGVALSNGLKLTTN